MSGITGHVGSRNGRDVRRSVVASLGAISVVLLLATPAAGAQPNHHACLGQDIRTYADGGAGFGSFVSAMATTTDGVGAEIQAHLAGQIPDAVQPNSCND